MKRLELLAPAKNLECGIAAIDHGADAVYIGAPRFGARAAAGNSVDDIAALCRYAHQFDAKVYVTTNTIIFDDELDDTFRLIEELQAIGVDAILIQDMSIVNWIARKHAGRQPLGGKSGLAAVAGFQSGSFGAGIVVGGDSRDSLGGSRCRIGSFCAWRVMRELQRPVLFVAALFRSLGESWRVCADVSDEVRPCRCRRS